MSAWRGNECPECNVFRSARPSVPPPPVLHPPKCYITMHAGCYDSNRSSVASKYPYSHHLSKSPFLFLPLTVNPRPPAAFHMPINQHPITHNQGILTRQRVDLRHWALSAIRRASAGCGEAKKKEGQVGSQQQHPPPPQLHPSLLRALCLYAAACVPATPTSFSMTCILPSEAADIVWEVDWVREKERERPVGLCRITNVAGKVQEVFSSLPNSDRVKNLVLFCGTGKINTRANHLYEMLEFVLFC